MKQRQFGVALGILLVLVGGVALMLSRKPGSVARLKDGSELRLLGVAMGTNGFTTHKSWHAVARRILPKQFQGWLPEIIEGAGQRTNTLSVWLQVRDPIHHTNIARNWERIDTVNKRGEVLNSDGASISYGRNYQAYALENFPRRHSSFLLRFYDTNLEPAAILRVPNPYRGPYPTWKADPMPVTKTDGELTATLKGMEVVWEEFPPGRTNSFLHVLGYELKWQDQPTTEWQQAWSELNDPTGNRIGGWHVGLADSEPVWRLQQWFTRTDDAQFSPEERFVIRNLPVQAAGSFTNLNIFTNFQGVGFLFFAFTGPAMLTVSNDVIIAAAPPKGGVENGGQVSFSSGAGYWLNTMNFTRPALLAAQTFAGYDRVVRYVFRNESGQRIGLVSTRDESWINQMINGRSGAQAAARKGQLAGGMLVQPDIPPETKTVSLEVIVQRARMLEFFVEPPRTGQWRGYKAEERNRAKK